MSASSPASSPAASPLSAAAHSQSNPPAAWHCGIVCERNKSCAALLNYCGVKLWVGLCVQWESPSASQPCKGSPRAAMRATRALAATQRMLCATKTGLCQRLHVACSRIDTEGSGIKQASSKRDASADMAPCVPPDVLQCGSPGQEAAKRARCCATAAKSSDERRREGVCVYTHRAGGARHLAGAAGPKPANTRGGN